MRFETKFGIEDVVFFLYRNGITQGEVKSLTLSKPHQKEILVTYVVLWDSGGETVEAPLEESLLFASPEEVTVNLLDRYSKRVNR